MGQRGQLTADQTGHAMPVDAPLYQKPPFYFRDVENISIHYETDEDALAALLPDVLELPDNPTATLMFLKYPFSTLGPYEETILGIPCTHEGQDRFYIPHIVLNADAPLAAGREVYGYPKKLADISFSDGPEGRVGHMARPKGNPIVSAGMRPEVPVEIPAEFKDLQVDSYTLALRVIPSPGEGEAPSVAQLIEINSKMTVKEVWNGTGWAKFHSASTLDPWHKLDVKRVVSATYQIYDMVLGFGRNVQDY